MHPSDGFTCSACGWSGRVGRVADAEWQGPVSDELMECAPRFCPNCGAGVVGRISVNP